jgi:hypothetical protein
MNSPGNFYVKGIFVDGDIYMYIPPKFDEMEQTPSVEYNPLLTMPALL